MLSMFDASYEFVRESHSKFVSEKVNRIKHRGDAVAAFKQLHLTGVNFNNALPLSNCLPFSDCTNHDPTHNS